MAEASEGVVAPGLFWLEIANVLRTRMLRGLIDAKARNGALARVRALGIVTPDASAAPDAVLDKTITLSDRHDLTIYDAAYLELALRLDVPLRTFDQALERAVIAAGLPA
jgi:predicted nucleic acid-binding protein